MGQIRIQYREDENSFVTISSENDVKDAVNFFREYFFPDKSFDLIALEIEDKL